MANGEHTMPSWLRRISATLTFGLLSVTSVFGNVSTAFAATDNGETQSTSQATVTLTDSEHGTLSFDNTEDKFLTVDVGTELTVNVAAQDGYSIDSLYVTGESSSSIADSDEAYLSGDIVTVNDGKATIVVEENINVQAVETDGTSNGALNLAINTATDSTTMGHWGTDDDPDAWTAYGDFTKENAEGISFMLLYVPISGKTSTYADTINYVKNTTGVDVSSLKGLTDAEKKERIEKLKSAINGMQGDGGFSYATGITLNDTGQFDSEDYHEGDEGLEHWHIYRPTDHALSVVDGMLLMIETSETDTAAFQSMYKTNCFAFYYDEAAKKWNDIHSCLVPETMDPNAKRESDGGNNLILTYPEDKDGVSCVNAAYDQPKVASLNIVKYDADTATTGGNVQGDADLAGVTLKVTNKSANRVQVKASLTATGWSFADGGTEVNSANEETYYEYAVDATVGYITMKDVKQTDGTYVTTGSTVNLPIGTYEITESEGNGSYNVNEDWKWTLKVVKPGDSTIGDDDYKVDINNRTVYVCAHSDNNVEDIDTPTLNEAIKHTHKHYTCVTCSKEFYSEETFEAHLKETQHDGYARSASDSKTYACNDCDFTTTNVAELRTHLSKKSHKSYNYKVVECTKNHTETGTTDNDLLTDDVKRYGAVVVKTDSETGLSAAQGDAELANTQYAVYNESKQSVVVNGVTYAKGQKIMTISTEWDADFVYNGQKGAYVASTNTYVQTDGVTSCDTSEGHETSGDSHEHCSGTLPYGSYRIKEIVPSVGYNMGDTKGENVFEASFDTAGQSDGWVKVYGNNDSTKSAGTSSVNTVMHGSSTVVKADYDTKTSVAQGNATLAGATYGIFNISQASKYNAKDGSVWSHQFNKLCKQTTADELKAIVSGVENGTEAMDDAIAKLKASDSLVGTAKTEYNEKTGCYEANFENLAYGTYIIIELDPPTGYHNGTQESISILESFSIRSDGEKHLFDAVTGHESSPSGYIYDHAWSEDQVIRGELVIAKVDRETGQYKALGDSSLENATFQIVNKSKAAIVYQGKSYEPDEVVTTISTYYDERSGKCIASTCDNLSYDAKTDTYSCSCKWDCQEALPYGDYEVTEINADKSVKYDTSSKQYVKSFSITEQNQVYDLTGKYDSDDFAANQENEGDPVANKPIREDFRFIKKSAPAMERMQNIAFKITSQTTGESHVIVTDENGEWGSAHSDHNYKTNANDPDSPTSNGALAIDADGNWYVADSSKLDCDAGTWFTGLENKYVTWADDGKSYTVSNDRGQGTSTVTVPEDSTCDGGRAFPYDTYTVEELRCDNNQGYELVTFTVTLRRDSKNPDDNGIEVDYGTVDDEQVTYEVSTKLTDADGAKIVPEGTSATLTDQVTWSGNGYKSGKKFTIKGELHVKNDDGTAGETIAKSTATFTGNGIGGTTEVTYSGVDVSSLGGKELVCFEYVYSESGELVASHEDASDTEQTVSVPHIGTKATGDVEQESSATNSTVKLTDTVSYSGLQIGKTYVMEGTLHYKNSDGSEGDVVTDANGNEVTAKTRFVPTETSGTVDVNFKFSNPGDLDGKTVVCFESLFKGDTQYATHADITDAGQSINFPKVRTKAINKADGTQMIEAAEKQTITDAVSYSNLTVGKEYKVTGELHIKNEDGTDGGVLKDADGNAYTAEKTFTAEKTSGSIDMEFEVDASDLAGKTLVVFENLYRDNIQLAAHADITDADQTINVPKIGTTLTADGDVLSKRPDDLAGEAITLVDTVAYENLTVGKEYTLTGELHTKNVDADGNMTDGGILKDKDGNEVTATTTFIPTETSGTADVKFAFTVPEDMSDKDLVAFESLTCKGETEDTKDTDVEKAKHEDITDEGQTVHFVGVHTTATDKATGTHQTAYNTTICIEDVVSTSNLVIGQEYTVKGTLHYKNEDGTDGGIVKDSSGDEVTAETTTTATKTSGDIVVTFKFNIDPADLQGKTMVAFEELYHNGQMFASHADISDEAQTVYTAELGTTLTGSDKSSKTVEAGSEVKLVDTVAYKNLVAGQKYILKGQLVDESGKAVTEVVSTEFTAEKADGTAEVEFTVDTSNFTTDTKLVAFEYLYVNNGETDVKVGQHEDLEDEGQTVTITVPDTETPGTPTSTTEKATLQTGIDSLALPAAIVALVAAAAAVVYFVRKRQSTED